MKRIRPILLAAAFMVLALAPRADGATGGPDAAGYTWSDVDEAGGDLNYPNFSSTDIRALGFTGNEKLWPITLPASAFPTGFPFYGQRYSRLWLSSNGWLSFVDPAGDPVPLSAAVPTPGKPDATIAFFWDDWTLDSTLPQALVGPNLAGDGFTIIVRYGMPLAPGRYSQLRVILWNTGVIKVIWSDVPTQMLGVKTQAGIENETGTIGLSFLTDGVAQNGANFRDSGFAVTYYPPASLDCTASPTPIACPAGPVLADNLAPLTNRVSAYGCLGGIWSGNEKVFELTVPAFADVTVKLTNTDSKNRAIFLVDPSCNELSGCLAGDPAQLSLGVLAAGNYYLVVDGASPSDNGTFTVETVCQSAAKTVTCGQVLTGEQTSGTGNLTRWSCDPISMPGPENIYELDVSGPLTLTATLSNMSVGGLYAHAGAAAGFDTRSPSCAVWGSPVATWYGADGKVLVSIDGTQASGGSYDLRIDCDRTLVCPGPAKVLDITNPAPVSGDSTGNLNSTESYYCGATNAGGPGPVTGLTGPEDIWEFTIATPQAVSFVLASANPNLRLLLLRDCYEGSCVAENSCGEDLPPGTYRVVVDGLNGAAGAYTISAIALPPVAYNLWTTCPECSNGCGQTPQTTQSKNWSFNSGNYCGTGCEFSLFAVVECGTEFHLPFYDVETGHLRVWDVYAQEFVNLNATNNNGNPSCLVQESGTTVQWEDSGCSQSPCPSLNCGGGSDCRTNSQVMDVSFQGTPSVCGIYRIDFINWGGFAWNAFANCSGGATELYYLYRDLCSAIKEYNPLPEIAITGVYIDNTTCGGTGDPQGTISVTNIGCLPANNVEIEIAPTTPPGPPSQTVSHPFIDKGETVSIPWTFPVPVRPYSLTFTVDPAGKISECSEGLGGSVRCGKDTAGKRVWQSSICGSNCNTLARSGPQTTICEGAPFVLNGASSRFQCTPTAVQEYRWEDPAGNPLPGCDWGINPNCALSPLLLTLGTHDYTLRTRCAGDLPCESQAYTQVIVSKTNIEPESLGNTLWAHRQGDDAVFWWPGGLSTPISGYSIHKDGIKWVPKPSRILAASAGPLEQTATDVGAVSAAPSPISYYQAVALSCLGDLESRY